MNPLVIIPARLGATRLPNKPMAVIAGRPMILHVVERALGAALGPVAVATDSPLVAEALGSSGAAVVMTSPDHLTGSDRVFEALGKLDPEGRHDVVINLQGDLPAISPAAIEAVFAPLDTPDVAIATLCAKIVREDERDDSNVVKLVGSPVSDTRLRALYFTRATAPFGDGPLYHHIGIYAYRRQALERFVRLPQSTLERRERLEQLRALEDGMRIDASVVDEIPVGVDTPADLERARSLIETASGLEKAP